MPTYASHGNQHTLAQPTVILEDVGLFTAAQTRLSMHPAPENHGIVFCRKDLPGEPKIPAHINFVIKRPKRTTLKLGDASIDMVEHILSAIAAIGLDNVLIELEGPEVPFMNGNSSAFYEAIENAGLQEQTKKRVVLELQDPIVVRDGDAMVVATPINHTETPSMVYELDHPNSAIGRLFYAYHPSDDDYSKDIGCCRTFSTVDEAKAAQAAGMFQHISAEQALVLDENGEAIGGQKLHHKDEPVRHKVLDLIGDIHLLGAPVRARIVAYKSGHALNQMLVKKLLVQLRKQFQHTQANEMQALDIRGLFKMMPHRYPMLLVDRVLEIDGSSRCVGIKNVTINEPFFQGHYPNTPIMPGVLIVEAMAQLSGVLIGQNIENIGKLPVLLSLDKVKLRKPVTPGDQLIIEAEAVRVRPRMAHMRCRAYVSNDVVAEAEIRFMLLENE